MRSILNGCILRPNEKGILKVYMPDGIEIPNTAGREIVQGLHEARVGIASVKLTIICNVEPLSEVPLDEIIIMRSYDNIKE